MNCRATLAHKFRTRLGIKQYDVILTKDCKFKKDCNFDLIVSLLELILRKKTLIFLELSMKYFDILNNQLKKL